MDIRFFIVGAPFVIAFFYTLFWLRKWGAFKLSDDNLSKKMTSKNQSIEECLELANKVGGMSTTKLGAGDSMPFLKEI